MMALDDFEITMLRQNRNSESVTHLHMSIFLLIIGPRDYIRLVKTHMEQVLNLFHLPFRYRLWVTYHPHGSILPVFNLPMYQVIHPIAIEIPNVTRYYDSTLL